MLHTSLSIAIGLAVVITFVFAVRLWLRQPWLRQWLRGTTGIVLLVLSVALGVAVWDLRSYRTAIEERPLATVSVYERGPQEYDLTLSYPDGDEARFILHGDQWQLDVRLLTWSGPLLVLGKESLYRLDRLSGRYLSLEQERTSPRSIYSLSESSGFDVWSWLRNFNLWLDADFGSAVYMPMENGAVFSVVRTGKGLVARPVNDVAEEAIAGQW